MGTDTAYAELGLAPGATEREAKAAWRRLVSLWHPDRNNQADALVRMQRINRAFEALRRAGFPATADGSAPAPPPPPKPASQAAAKPAPQPAPQPAAKPAAASAQAGPDCGQGEASAEAPQATPRSRTVSRKLKLTLEEAALGCTKVLRGKAASCACSGCAGAGWRPTGAACAGCDGTGTLRQRTWYGMFGSASTCAACGGSGLARQPCVACGGGGQCVVPGYRVTVRLPSGVRDGDSLQVDGRRMRPDQSPGDLLIRVAVLAHPFFVLDDDGTLRCELPVNGFAWLANRPLAVPTLAGLHTLALDREQRDYRLAGQGFPVSRRGPRADLLIRIQPSFPDRLSTDQQILLDQLVATGMGPEGSAADARLAAWQAELRDWQHGLQAQASPAPAD